MCSTRYCSVNLRWTAFVASFGAFCHAVKFSITVNISPRTFQLKWSCPYLTGFVLREKVSEGHRNCFLRRLFWGPNSVMMIIGNVPTETSMAFILHIKKITGLDDVYLDLKLKMILAVLYPIIVLFILRKLTLILWRSRTGTVWFYTSTSNKRAARPKLYTKSLTRDLKICIVASHWWEFPLTFRHRASCI